MTLTNCPECSRQISSTAIQCPQCGHDMRIKHRMKFAAVIGIIALATALLPTIIILLYFA